MSRIVRNTVALTTAHIVTKILAIGMAVGWARFLGAERLGRLSVVISIAAILSVIADLGLNLVTVREVSRKTQQARGWLQRALFLKLGLGVVVLFVAVPLSGVTSAGVLGVPLLIATLAIVMESPMHLMNGIFRAFQRMELEAITVTTWRLGVTAFTLLALAAGFGVTGVTAGLLIGASAGTLMAFLLLRSRRLLSASDASPPPAGTMMKLALPYGLQAVLATIYFRIDIVMLSRFQGDQETGLYQAAYHLLEGILFVPYALAAALLPALSADYASARLHDIDRRLNSGLKAALLVGVPAAAGLYLTGSLIAPWIFGAEFSGSAVFLLWLAPTIPLMFISLLLGTAVGAVDRQFYSVLATGSCVVVNIGLNLILIPRMGGRGAALATLVAEVILLTALAVPLIRSGAWRLNIPAWPAIVVSTMVMSAVVFFARSAGAIPAVLSGIISYGSCILLFRGVTFNEVRRLTGMAK